MTAIADLNVDKLFRIDGDVAMVTGAGSGFGRIAALTLAGAGARIAVTDVSAETARAVAEEISTAGGEAVALEMDVTDRPCVAQTVAEVVRVLGGLDILINNAGITRRGPTESMADEDWDAVVAVNMTGPFVCAREAGRHMLANGGGRMVNMASIMGLAGNGVFSHIGYQATKGALVNMTRGLAVEWADRGIRVNALAPTFFRTSFGSNIQQNPDMVRKIETRTPMGRFGEPEELAGPILFLVSPAASMVTGHTLPVDGGWLAC